MAKGQKGIDLKSDKARRAARAASRETTPTSTGSQAGVVAKSKSASGAVLRSENAAKDKGNSHDALKACHVLIGAAYRVGKDLTQIEPNILAFGKGVPVDMAVGISIDASGKATVKVTCRVDGREVVLGD